jgi:hypothetical protein
MVRNGLDQCDKAKNVSVLFDERKIKMKRLVLFVIVGLLIVSTAYIVSAGQQNEKTDGGMTPKACMPNCPMPNGPMSNCPMCPAMCQSMMSKSLVATNDGGVILMTGCQLVKYDKDLNKVKEVQIEVDMDKMKDKMQSMMKACPMCCPMKNKEKK